mmetsp:Transcript_7873/g.33501  ORF Transcript_7873/g.33501 Transcript_7873/m.33501 type:complete len:277 (-) Transcript_7873:827-1657(-)
MRLSGPEQRARLFHEAFVFGRVRRHDVARRGHLPRRFELRRELVDVYNRRRFLGERGGVLRRAQRGGLGLRGSHDRGVEHVRHDLPPQFRLRPAAHADELVCGGQTQLGQTRRAASQSVRRALHRRSIRRRRILKRSRPQAEQRARGLRPVGRALAHQVRQETHAVAARGDKHGAFLERSVRRLFRVLDGSVRRPGARLLDDARAVERAQQGQVPSERVAEGRDGARDVEHGHVAGTEQCARCAQRHHETPGPRGADADGGARVISRTRGHRAPDR